MLTEALGPATGPHVQPPGPCSSDNTTRRELKNKKRIKTGNRAGERRSERRVKQKATLQNLTMLTEALGPATGPHVQPPEPCSSGNTTRRELKNKKRIRTGNRAGERSERRVKQKEGLQYIPFTSILYNLFPPDPS
jgi:hypothetical protein